MSEKKTETMLLRTPDQAPRTSPLLIEAAGQRYRQATQFSYLGGLINASADIMSEINQRVRLAWACYKRFKRELYDMKTAPFTLKVRMLKAEVMRPCCTGVQRGPSARSTSPSCERHTTGLSCGSLASSADNAQITSCRTPRSSRRHNARASRQYPQTVSPLRGGRTTDEQ